LRVRERQPSTRTVLQGSPTWWNKFETNLDEVVVLPIEKCATRVVASLSGDVEVLPSAARRRWTGAAADMHFAWRSVLDGKPDLRRALLGAFATRHKNTTAGEYTFGAPKHHGLILVAEVDPGAIRRGVGEHELAAAPLHTGMAA